MWMRVINYQELHNSIKESGISITKIAEHIGMSREGLYKKLNGESDFRLSEFWGLCNVINVKHEDLIVQDEVNEIHSDYSVKEEKPLSLKERLNNVKDSNTDTERAKFELSNELFIEVCKGIPVDLLFSELQKSSIEQVLKDELAADLADYIEWRSQRHDRRRC